MPKRLRIVLGALALTAAACQINPDGSFTISPDEAKVLAHLARPLEDGGGNPPCGQWLGTLRSGGIPEPKLRIMLTLMRRESNCLPWVHSRTDDWGLLQINAPSHLGRLCFLKIACTRQDLLDPLVNARAAENVLSIQGLRAWATYHGH